MLILIIGVAALLFAFFAAFILQSTDLFHLCFAVGDMSPNCVQTGTVLLRCGNGDLSKFCRSQPIDESKNVLILNKADDAQQFHISLVVGIDVFRIPLRTRHQLDLGVQTQIWESQK